MIEENGELFKLDGAEYQIRRMGDLFVAQDIPHSSTQQSTDDTVLEALRSFPLRGELLRIMEEVDDGEHPAEEALDTAIITTHKHEEQQRELSPAEQEYLQVNRRFRSLHQKLAGIIDKVKTNESTQSPEESSELITNDEARQNLQYLLPVPVDAVPEEVRLLRILPDLINVADKVDRPRGLRAQNAEVVREAFQYTPVFAREVSNELMGINALLTAKGFVPENDNETILEKYVADTLNEYSSKLNLDNGTKTAQEITRIIFRIFHPDVVDDDLTEVFSNSEQNEIYSRALKIARHKDGEAAQELLLETMPKYYLHKVKKMQKQGKSLAEIAASNPQLTSDLEYVALIATIRPPKEGLFRLFQDPKDAKLEAFRIKKMTDQNARYAAFNLILSVTRDVIAFAKTKGLIPELAAHFDTLQEFMSKTSNLVGQLDMLSHVGGNSLLSPEVKRVHGKIESYIKEIPQRIQRLAGVVVFSNSGSEFEQVINELRYTVASVKSCSEDSIEELLENIRKKQSGINPDIIRTITQIDSHPAP